MQKVEEEASFQNAASAFSSFIPLKGKKNPSKSF